MAVIVRNAPPAPRWPAETGDPARAYVAYDAPADELVVYFEGRPRGGVCDPIDALGGDVALIYDDETLEVVGVQVMPLLVGAVMNHPRWATIAWDVLAGDFGAEELRAPAVADLFAVVAEAYARHGFDRMP